MGVGGAGQREAVLGSGGAGQRRGVSDTHPTALSPTVTHCHPLSPTVTHHHVQSRALMVGEVAEVVAPEEDSPLRMGWDNWYYDISVVGGLGLDEDGQLAVAVMCKVRRGDLGSGAAEGWGFGQWHMRYWGGL